VAIAGARDLRLNGIGRSVDLTGQLKNARDILKPEEMSILGLLLVMFGISWLGFAAVQPIPTYTSCGNGGFGGYPQCGSPGPLAETFYALGAFALVVGLILLVVRALK
jgi:hypothetical protein